MFSNVDEQNFIAIDNEFEHDPIADVESDS